MHEHSMKMDWNRFATMIAVSTAIMFVLMYQLVYQWDHVMFSLTRLVGAFVMGCVMTAIMLAFMWRMYEPQKLKVAVLAAAILGGGVLLLVNRSQALVGDTNFMKAMIPHHSIAINNARRSDIRDPRVRYLADRITRDQVKEILEMKLLLADIERNGRLADEPLPADPATIGEKELRESRDLLSGKLLREKPL
jgi:hypothetical protein